MKRVTGIAIFLICVIQIVEAQPAADIQFEKMDHNFGKIKEEGGPVNYNFNFTNTGKAPLVIQGVEASCGCTTPEWSQEPILPGKSGFIKVSYNPELRPGVFDKSIMVNANVPKSPVVLTISGEVIPRVLNISDIYPVDFGKIRLTSDELSFVKIKDNESKTDTLKFYNPGTLPVSVNLRSFPAHVSVKPNPGVVQPKSKGFFLITFDATKKPAYGYVKNRIYLSFNGEENFDHAIKVSAIVEEDFSKLSAAELANAPQITYSNTNFDFGEIPEGKKIDCTFKIINTGKRELVIRSMAPSCDCMVGQLGSNTIQPDQSAGLKISFDSKGRVGRQSKTITIISNDPARPTTMLRLTGTVKK